MEKSKLKSYGNSSGSSLLAGLLAHSIKMIKLQRSLKNINTFTKKESENKESHL